MSKKSRARKARRVSPEMQAYLAERADIVKQADGELAESNRELAKIRVFAQNGGDKETARNAARKVMTHSDKVKARKRAYLQGLRQRFGYLFEGGGA